MNAWWLSKTPREQLALVLAAAALLLFLLYLLAWQPFMEAVEQRRLQVRSQEATLDWMQQNLAEVQRLKSLHRSAGGNSTNEALLTLVDRTAKERRLRQQIQRIKPQGEDSVQLWVEQASFDILMQWLGGLNQQHGIEIESLNLERQELSGIVNARLVLQRAGAG